MTEEPVYNIIQTWRAKEPQPAKGGLYMPNMIDEGNPTTIQSRRDRKTVRSKQNSIGPSKKGDITFTITLSARIDDQATMLDHLPNGTTEVHQTSQATSKHHCGRQIQKIGREKVPAQRDRRGSSMRPTAMHRMAENSKPQKGANTGGN
ncbi:unnamed protein product [Microthlaspi erraticum]|uniref:Uncharacterized protein n=1 Tax=Microthlaspi erraticum TaxID=1685480 RepID=A0A6D2KF83_9BRAS|nr:unnamed protein product [Microthlaspi erraticum]